MSSVIEFPPTVELEFETPEQCAEFERNAAAMGMTPSEFTFYLFEWYRTNADEKDEARNTRTQTD